MSAGGISIDFDGKSALRKHIVNAVKESVADDDIDTHYWWIEKKYEVKKPGSDAWEEIKPVETVGATQYYECPPQAKVRGVFVVNWTALKPKHRRVWELKIIYQNDPSKGGHEHSSLPPPNFTNFSGEDLDNPIETGEMPGGKKYTLGWKAPEYATRAIWDGAWLIAEVRRAFHRDIIDVKVSGLEEMEPGTGYELVGSTLAHPGNHYGTKPMNGALQNLAIEYQNACPGAAYLSYNDISCHGEDCLI